jgi:hypothetical protein
LGKISEKCQESPFLLPAQIEIFLPDYQAVTRKLKKIFASNLEF